MDKNFAVETLRKNFEKWADDHLETLRFLVSHLYQLFNSIIAISVAIVGIIIPIILNSDYPTNTFLLRTSFIIFVAVVLFGIIWQFVKLKGAENKWPKIFTQESNNFHKSVSEIRETNSSNFLEIIERNFQSGMNKNAYRTKVFEIVFIILFCLGIILLSFSLLASNIRNSTFQEIGDARLGLEGQELKLLVADTKGQLGKLFLFQNDSNLITATLSVENLNIEGPKFRIVKGHNRDWLVVTTIESSGTGYMKHIDTWYVANPYYQGNLAVLSYPSDSLTTDGSGMSTEKLTTNTKIADDDNVIDVESVLEDCTAEDKCTTTTKTARYVWDSDQKMFVPNNKKSDY